MNAARGPARVLALVTEAYGGMGGIARYNRDFCAALASLPGIGTIDLLARGGDAGQEAPPRGSKLHRPRPGRAAFGVAALRLAIRTKPQIVVCGHLFMVSLAAVLARLCGARLLVQLHGIEVWRRLPWHRRRALERADLVLCVSRDTRARILALTDLPPERILVLPNTVSDRFTPGPPVVPPAVPGPLAASGPQRLLSVGRLDAREAYKGHDAVIACLPDLGARGFDPIYDIAGDGDDRARLEQLARHHGVADRVRFLGAVSDSELRDLYRRADLFVLPSRGEGFGIVFLEAMACGTPALGLAQGGAVDALEGLGRALRPGESLADAVAEELDRAAREPRLDRGRHLAARVRARFGWAAFVRGVGLALSRLGVGSTSPGDPDEPGVPSCPGCVESAA